jgi:hypothetical protein
MASRAARRHLWELGNAKTQFKAAIPVADDSVFDEIAALAHDAGYGKAR